MTRRLVWLLLIGASGCGKSPHGSALDRDGAITAPAPVAPGAASQLAPALATVPAPEEDLHLEARETDPHSETVKLKLITSPPVKAVVWLGHKKLGVTPLELERPRNSGPLDLILRGEGYLAFHTRLFTDRDDKLTVHMVRPAEASGVLGYRGTPPLSSP